MSALPVQTPEELKGKLQPSPEVVGLQDKVAQMKASLKALRKEEGRINLLTNEIVAHIEAYKPPKVTYVSPTGSQVSSPCSVVCHTTDWHYGENQVSSEIEGFGEFSRAIARSRIIDNFVPSILDWVTLHRKNYTVDELVILATADMISGDIHRELIVTNEVPSPVQSVEVAHLFADMVKLFTPFFKSIRIEWIVVDNHSRLTPKPQAKEAGFNSFNYIVSKMVEQILSSFETVTMNIYPAIEKVVEVQNMRYLCTHGGEIQGWAGHPYYGMDRRAGKESMRRSQKVNMEFNKSGKDMDELYRLFRSYQFDKLLMGHFHAPLYGPWWSIGGSLSGTSAYDHKYGRFARPSQTSWIVHPKHGEFDYTVWSLD